MIMTSEYIRRADCEGCAFIESIIKPPGRLM